MAAAEREQKKIQFEADKRESDLLSQLKDLQADKDSLTTDLERRRDEANEAAAKEDETRIQLATFKSDITATRLELKESQKH